MLRAFAVRVVGGTEVGGSFEFGCVWLFCEFLPRLGVSLTEYSCHVIPCSEG